MQNGQNTQHRDIARMNKDMGWRKDSHFPWCPLPLETEVMSKVLCIGDRKDFKVGRPYTMRCALFVVMTITNFGH